MDWLEVIITAIPDWLSDPVDVIVTAVPDFGTVPVFMLLGGMLLLMAWYYDFV